MNKTSRIASTINCQANALQLRTCFFHSTPVLERRRRTNWDNARSFRSSPKNFNQYTERLRKQSLLHNANEFAEHIFKSWQADTDWHEQPSRGRNSWFRQDFNDNVNKRGRSRNRRSRAERRDFEFCDVDDDIKFENIFRSAFGGSKSFYWCFTLDDEPRSRSSSDYSRHRRYEFKEEYDSSSESGEHLINTKSDRLALGLSASGPLNLEDVKNAYRACALKWHPDRHQGNTKIVAEEKFKVCSAAYQSLCDNICIRDSL